MKKKELIKLENVKKSYYLGKREIPVLKGITLTIFEGDYIAIMGPSGSGKSTLMNIIGLLDKPTSGNYFLDNNLINNLSDSKVSKLRNKYIGFIFQLNNLLPQYTALKNVELPLIYRGVNIKERRRIAKYFLEYVGLKDRKNNLAKQLSGGEQQRVAIARALSMDTPIILADEPTGSLDSKTSEKVMSLFQYFNEKGKTIILVTHDKYVASKANKILNFRDGVFINESV